MATHPGTATGATYVYCLASPTRADINPRWADTVYGDDLHYVFGQPLTTDSSATQRALSLLVMRYWVNFIRSGLVAVTVIPYNACNSSHKRFPTCSIRPRDFFQRLKFFRFISDFGYMFEMKYTPVNIHLR